jgi:hypothetical protein
MRRVGVILLLLLTFVYITKSSKAYAGDNFEDQFLHGLKGVSIRVQVFAGDDNTNSSWASQVRNDVESRLRRAGIPIIETDEPKLAVTVLASKSKECGYAAHVQVTLLQRARLQRDPTVTVMAGTWTQGGVYTFDADNFRYVRDEIQDTVDRFANAYLTANPK